MRLERLERFKWDDVAAELTARAPTLHSVLKMCIEAKRRARPLKRSHRNSDVAVMFVCASVILRHKNQHMNALQNIISLLGCDCVEYCLSKFSVPPSSSCFLYISLNVV